MNYQKTLLWLLLCASVLAACGDTAAPSTAGTSTETPTAISEATKAPDAAENKTKPQDLMSVAEWEAKFLRVWDDEDELEYHEWSHSGDSRWHYFLGYAIDGNTAMYEATCNTDYLDRALEYIDNVVETAEISSSLPNSQYEDSYLGWEAIDEPDVNGEEVPLYESYMWRYVTKLLRVIRQNPRLYDDPSYRDQYESLLEFTEVNIFEKWFSRDPSSIYRSHTHMASHWAFIALDLSLLTEDETRKERYQEVLLKINTDLSPFYESSLRAQIKPNPQDDSAYFWDAQWGSSSRPGQDTSHGNGVVAYMIEAYDQGVYWTAADIDGIKNLLIKVLWNGSLSDPSFSGYFDGSEPGEGWFVSDGFVKLGRYDAAIQHIFEEFSGQESEESYLTQYYGNAALNAKLLGATDCADCRTCS